MEDEMLTYYRELTAKMESVGLDPSLYRLGADYEEVVEFPYRNYPASWYYYKLTGVSLATAILTEFPALASYFPNDSGI